MNCNFLLAEGVARFVTIAIVMSVAVHGQERSYKSRLKGEIACYSCFAKNPSRATTHSQNIGHIPTQSLENMTDLLDVLAKGGMKVPRLVDTCADTTVSTIPTFAGSNIHICTNTEEHPGACVKLRGVHNGESFVYRECWNEMWRHPRPYKRQMSGHCFADEMVQNFVASEKNVICFCEDDLCNNQNSIFTIVSSLCLISALLVLHYF